MDLKGKTILTTRAASQSGEFRVKLEALGARVIECPTIEIVPVDDWTAVDEAIRRMNSYQWLLFTSANAVDLFMKRVALLGVSCSTPIAVVGTATARSLEGWNLKPSVIPSEFRSEGLLEALPMDLTGSSILFPRAETARELLPYVLRERGAVVDIVTVYRTVRSNSHSKSIADVLSSEKVDCIVFTSASAIPDGAESERIEGIPIAVIGPVTRDAAVARGLSVAIMPGQATIDDLITKIADHLT